MKHNRHSVLKIPRPPGWSPTSPDQVPESYVLIPRIDLGRAAQVALELNRQEIAKGDDAAFFYVPLKTFEPAKRRRPQLPQLPQN